MDKNIIGVLIIIASLFGWIRWWATAKRTPYKVDVVLLGISWLIAIGAYITGMAFHIGPLLLVSVFAFLCFWFLLIRAGLAERRFKKR